MHFVVANIVRPLTCNKRESFVTLWGGRQVDYFVSLGHVSGSGYNKTCFFSFFRMFACCVLVGCTLPEIVNYIQLLYMCCALPKVILEVEFITSLVFGSQGIQGQCHPCKMVVCSSVRVYNPSSGRKSNHNNNSSNNNNAIHVTMMESTDL